MVIDKKGQIHFKNRQAERFLDMYKEKLNIKDPVLNILNKIMQKKFKIKINDYEYILKVSKFEKEERIKYAVEIYDSKYIYDLTAQIKFEEVKTILDSTQDAICIDDEYGNTLWINKACEELYQVNRLDIIGTNIDLLEKEGVFNPSVAKLVFEQKRKMTILHSNKNGKKILTTGTPLFTDDGKIDKVISTSRDVTELMILKNKLEDIENELEEVKEQQESHDNLIVKSQKMKEVMKLARRLSQIDTTVLITGESGVGKGEIAKYIHKLGKREDKPFVKVNCGAIPESLIESELFGYEGGAFTGSRKKGKKGLFEMAQNGTIFLDEIGELPLHLQVKILQAIQDKEIQRVGGTSTVKVNVRIIAATNRELKEMVEKGQFREDLYYRLNVVPIYIPPLRDRKEDIYPIIRYFLTLYNDKFDLQKRIDPNAIDYLIRYSWPGNVRELENIIERLVVTTREQSIVKDNLPNYILKEIEKEENYSIINVPNMGSLKDTVEEVEKQIIHKALKKYKTTREVAKALGVSQPTVVRKINKYYISYDEVNRVN